MTNFHIGQKVCCIDDANWEGYGFEKRPVRGGVYTIREIQFSDYSQETALLLEEIVNPPSRYIEGFCESSFFARRFRPVRTTNIDVFKALLETLRVEA